MARLLTPEPEPSPPYSASVNTRLYERIPLNLLRQEIRILEIQPDIANSSSTVLQTKLRCIELGAAQYTCLSYTWGVDLHPEPILVNSEPFLVYENVWLMLSAMRTKHFYLPMWIDLICIDQCNTVERNHQVHQMANIYRTAEQVLVWLGPSTAAQDELFAMLGAVDVTFRGPSNNGVEARQNDLAKYNRHVLLEDRHWEAFSVLCYNSYWTRLWIVQEVRLAREVTVIWGKNSLPWGLLVTFCTLVRASDDNRQKLGLRRHVTAELIQNILGLNDRLHASLSLFEATAVFHGQVCRDLRDHVYGVLGLVCDGVDFLVNYKESTPYLYLRALENEARRRDLCAVPYTPTAVCFSNDVRSALGLASIDAVPQIVRHRFVQFRPIARLSPSQSAASRGDVSSSSLDFWELDEDDPPASANSRLDLFSISYGEVSTCSDPPMFRHCNLDTLPCHGCIVMARAWVAKREPSVFTPTEDGNLCRWTDGPPPRLFQVGGVLFQAGAVGLVTRFRVIRGQDGIVMHLDGILSNAVPDRFHLVIRHGRPRANVPEGIDVWIVPECFSPDCRDSTGENRHKDETPIFEGRHRRIEQKPPKTQSSMPFMERLRRLRV